MPRAGESHPDYSMLRPVALPLADGVHALVAGWLGVRCASPGTMTPAFSVDITGSGTELCPATASRNFTVDGATGTAVRTSVQAPHALAAGAVLDDGSVVITGGIQSLLFEAQDAVDVFTGDVEGGAAVAAMRRTLLAPRMLHDTAPLWGHGYLTTGGVTFSASVRDATLVPDTEVYFF